MNQAITTTGEEVAEPAPLTEIVELDVSEPLQLYEVQLSTGVNVFTNQAGVRKLTGDGAYDTLLEEISVFDYARAALVPFLINPYRVVSIGAVTETNVEQIIIAKNRRQPF